MAVFLLKSRYGICYTPPPCTVPAFPDVPCTSIFAPWINELVAQGITTGCGGGNFCPDNPVNRQQMGVFLLKTLEGSGYTPPACTVAHVRGRSVFESLCALDLRARRPQHHGRLRRRELLPTDQRQSRTNGRIPGEDVQPSINTQGGSPMRLAVALLLALRAASAAAATFTVTTTSDSGAGSLRQALRTPTPRRASTRSRSTSPGRVQRLRCLHDRSDDSAAGDHVSRPHRRLHAGGLLDEHQRDGRDQRRPQDRRLRPVAPPFSDRTSTSTPPEPPARRCGASSSMAALPRV